MALDLGGRHDEAARRLRLAAPHAARRRRLARLLPRQRDRGPDARHQRHLLRRHRRVAPPPLHRRHRAPPASSGRWSRRAIDFALDFQTRDRRDRVARRRPRRRRAAHRLVEHPPQPACAIAIAERLGHERPDWELSLGSLAIAIAHRPERVPRQGPLGDGLVLPDPRRRAARPARRRAHRVDGRRSWSRAAASAACRTVRGSPRPRRASWSWRSTPSASHEHARDLFGWVQFLRADGGGYWTGVNFDDERFHRDRRALSRRTAHVELGRGRARGERARRRPVPTAGLFRGEATARGPQRRRAARRPASRSRKERARK